MNLDTLVATAMRWPVIDGESSLLTVSKMWGGYIIDGVPHVFSGSDIAGKPFHPSTNIAHAHMFRDKVLLERKWWKCLTEIQFVNTDKKRAYCCVMDELDQYRAAVNHDSEPTALCLALLRATRVSEEKINKAIAASSPK